MALDSSAVTKRRIVSPFRKKAGIPSGGLAKKDKITGKDKLFSSEEAMDQTYEKVKDYNREFSLENIN